MSASSYQYFDIIKNNGSTGVSYIWDVTEKESYNIPNDDVKYCTINDYTTNENNLIAYWNDYYNVQNTLDIDHIKMLNDTYDDLKIVFPIKQNVQYSKEDCDEVSNIINGIENNTTI